MRFVLCLFVLAFSLQSCIHVLSTKRGYDKLLSASAKEHILFAGSEASFNLSALSRAEKVLPLVSGKQLKDAIRGNDWTIIYNYHPYCPSDDYISPQKLQEKLSSEQLKYWVVLRYILDDSIVQLSDKYPLIGIDYQYYNKTRCESLFLEDLLGKRLAEMKQHRYSLYYLFYHDQLVYSSDELDALLNWYQQEGKKKSI